MDKLSEVAQQIRTPWLHAEGSWFKSQNFTDGSVSKGFNSQLFQGLSDPFRFPWSNTPYSAQQWIAKFIRCVVAEKSADGPSGTRIGEFWCGGQLP